MSQMRLQQFGQLGMLRFGEQLGRRESEFIVAVVSNLFGKPLSTAAIVKLSQLLHRLSANGRIACLQHAFAARIQVVIATQQIANPFIVLEQKQSQRIVAATDNQISTLVNFSDRQMSDDNQILRLGLRFGCTGTSP